MTNRKTAVVTTVIMAMFLGILVFIIEINPDAAPVIGYCFAVPGVAAVTWTLYRWLKGGEK